MKYNKLLIINLFLVIVIIFGCKKDINKEFTDTPIIESYLEPGGNLTLTVSRQIPFSSNVEYAADDINNLAITVTCNNLSYLLTPLDSGKYIDSAIALTEGGNYNISFSYNSKSVKAYTYIPAKPVDMAQSATEIIIAKMDSASGPPSSSNMPDPIKITWNNPDASYYLLLVENMETTLDPIRDFGGKEPPGHRFRKAPTNSTSEEIRDQDFQYYGMHRIILYHVLPDYAALYKQSNTSSQNLTNPSTSITNGYGIFTGLNSDTMYVNVKKQ